MKRAQFIRTMCLGSFATFTVPEILMAQHYQTYSRAQLTGRGNPELTGTSYTSVMHRETRKSFDKMKAAAASEGVVIQVVSAYRSFDRQKTIFEQKYRRFLSQGIPPELAIEKIIEYSTIPGTSRHHWGTDLDLIDGSVTPPENILDPIHFHGGGPFEDMRKWLDNNAERFDFHLVYTDHPDRKGFNYEPWHYSYAPVAIPMLRAFCELDIKKILTQEKVLGSDYFSEVFIDRYKKENLLDINPRLL